MGPKITVIAAATIILCQPSVAAGIPVALADCANHKTDCKDVVGMTLWVNIPRGNPNLVEVHPGPEITENSIKLKTGASFVVTGTVKDRTIGHLLSVRLSDGRRGYMSPSFNYLFISNSNPIEDARRAREDCAHRGQPKIGMTPAELIETCWRKPRRVVKKTTAAGVEENYVYSLGHIVKVVDGKVTEIIESR